MDEEGKGATPPEEKPKEKTPAEIMADMKAEFDARLADKEAEIAELKAKHAKEIADILTGKDFRKQEKDDFDTMVENAAREIAKNVGGEYVEEKGE